MNRFSLSKPNQKVLPDTVIVSGSTFLIRPGYRNILRILRMLDDPELLPSHKPMLLRQWFYVEDAPDDFLSPFYAFLAGEQKQDGSNIQTFCFEFDAPEIYAAFWQEYGMDLLQTELHWYQFQILLTGIMGGENAFSRKVRLRTLDTSKYENKAELERAKAAVQIPAVVGRTEQKLHDAITEALISGGDIAGLVRQVKENGGQ